MTISQPQSGASLKKVLGGTAVLVGLLGVISFRNRTVSRVDRPDEPRIEERREPPDEAAGLELLDPLVDGGRRESDRPGDLGLRQLPVALEHVQNPEIDVVDAHPGRPYKIRRLLTCD